jgi:tetratricopeptide (TPR) repeat protein
LAQSRADYDRAESYWQESLALWRTLGNQSKTAVILSHLGFLAAKQGNLELAQTYYEDSLQMEQRLGNTANLAVSLLRLGLVRIEQGRHREAGLLFRESFLLHQFLGNKFGMTESLAACNAVICLTIRDTERARQAAQLDGAVQELLHASSSSMDLVYKAKYEYFLRAVHQYLDEHAFAAARLEGRALSSDDVGVLCLLQLEQALLMLPA